MKYIVQVGERRLEVELDAGGVRVDGVPTEASLADAEGTPLRLLSLGAEVHRVVVLPGDARGRYALWLDGYRVEVEALDERTRAIRELSAASAPSGPAPLLAPMPGLIVRVHVQAGEAVRAGQGLVAMEAMKMENELRAAAAGTVRRIHVQPGTAVEKGALLVELE